jgi:bacterioferritin
MKGKDKVIEVLNDLLAGELTAIDQYFIHSRMYEDMGLSKLFERLDHEREEETDHADQMIKRLLFLEGVPQMSKRETLNVGATVPEMLKNDLELEYSVINNLKAAIAICERESDYETRAMLVKQLEDSEEDHAYWLEKQLGLIDRVGLQNYLQSQM